MRWLVEVIPLGSTEKESLQVDADSWQGALQAVRSKRGEADGIGGFSIDLLNDGCRAVDPASRVSYDVRKAPEGATGSLRPPAAVPRPQSQTPLPPAPQPPSASKIVFKREQDRTQALPLTYREYVYLAPLGTTEGAAEALLRAQLERIRTSLANVPAGKLVNLAVFDRPFEGKATAPPVATLEWKDWRPKETVAFPRQAAEYTAPTVPPAQAVTVTPVVMVENEPVAPPPAPAAATAFGIAESDPFAAPKPATPPPAPSSDDARPSQPPPSSQPSLSRRSSTPRLPAPGTRLRGEDLIADLFEAMSDLHFLRDTIEAGDFCLTQVMQRLPCQAGLIHLYDIDRREFVVTNGEGAGTRALLLRRHPENEALLSKAMRGRKALIVDTGRGDAPTAERYQVLGGAKCVLVAPVMQSGRFLGAIELVNPLDGLPFTDVEGNGVTYVAEQLAEYVANHGVITDPDRINARRSG
jgi:GAF domain-containing protein